MVRVFVNGLGDLGSIPGRGISKTLMWTQSRYTEGKHGTQFRGKKVISTKVTKDSVQYC